jgi:hypothetical protein
MIMEVRAYGDIKDSLLKIRGRKSFDLEIAMMTGNEVEIIVRKKKKTRSLNQNAYYWGVVIPIIKQGLFDLGIIFSHEQCHDLLKFRFLKEDQHLKDGLFVERIKSTTELSTSEFMDYMSDVTRWAAEYLSISIPEPNEQQQFSYD